MKTLKDLVVVVTGASSGIGLATARQFSQQGAKVALIARVPDKLETLAAAMRAAGGTVLPVPLDVTAESDVAAAFAKVEAELGPVDILVNAAGVGFATDLSRCSLADFRRIFDTNVTGVFLCTRAVVGGMRARKSGHVINISSIAGKTANPNAPLYCASKAALNSYTSGLQQQAAADRDRRVKRAAIAALGQVGPDAIPALRGLDVGGDTGLEQDVEHALDRLQGGGGDSKV